METARSPTNLGPPKNAVPTSTWIACPLPRLLGMTGLVGILQPKADLHCHLNVADPAIVNFASYRPDLEPIHVPKRFAGPV